MAPQMGGNMPQQGQGGRFMQPPAASRPPRILLRYKTKLCSFFMDSGGAFCPHGESCQFAHGYEDLRTAANAPPSVPTRGGGGGGGGGGYGGGPPSRHGSGGQPMYGGQGPSGMNLPPSAGHMPHGPSMGYQPRGGYGSNSGSDHDHGYYAGPPGPGPSYGGPSHGGQYGGPHGMSHGSYGGMSSHDYSNDRAPGSVVTTSTMSGGSRVSGVSHPHPHSHASHNMPGAFASNGTGTTSTSGGGNMSVYSGSSATSGHRSMLGGPAEPEPWLGPSSDPVSSMSSALSAMGLHSLDNLGMLPNTDVAGGANSDSTRA
jgi:hypothetical protein